MIRRGIVCAVPSERFEVVGEASDFSESLSLARKVSPEVTVMNLGTPPAEGIAFIRQFRRKVPESRVLVFCQHDAKEEILESALAGAHGFVSKTASPKELVQGIDGVISGRANFGRRIDKILNRKTKKSENRGGSENVKLTPRETEVLVLIAEGLTNKEMGEKIALSSRTIETHRERMMQKLGIHTVAGLTRYAVRHGYIGIE